MRITPGTTADAESRGGRVLRQGKSLVSVLTVLAASIALSTLSACGDDGGGDGRGATTLPRPGPTTTTTSTAASTLGTVKAGEEDIPVRNLVAGVAAVCAAAAGAVSGDIASARARFLDSAHEAMHDLARAVEVPDRSSAARLLEAKQAVESDLGSGATAGTLAQHLFGLFDAGAAALDRLAIPAPPCQK